jgi:hypothetical protein
MIGRINERHDLTPLVWLKTKVAAVTSHSQPVRRTEMGQDLLYPNLY